MDLSKEEKKSLEGLKQVLERRAGIRKDPLVAANVTKTTGNALWSMRCSCAKRLKRLILMKMLVRQLQTFFVTEGFVLRSRQVVLKGRPTTMDKAIEEAVTVEEALRCIPLAVESNGV